MKAPENKENQSEKKENGAKPAKNGNNKDRYTND